MHIGHNNVKYNHKSHSQNFIIVTEKMYLGVIVTSALKCATQCSTSNSKANVIVGFIACLSYMYSYLYTSS